MTSVLVVQPDESDPLERLGAWLDEAGLVVHVVRPYRGEPVPDVLEHDALVVLGGDMGAGDVDAHPWLEDVMALLRTAVAESTPTLGICLGGQLLAAATGGRVEPGGAGTEAGTVLVRPRPEAADDPLLAALPAPFRMITMHRDAVTALPPDAVWLADSTLYGHQAFRVGAAAWGVQFHPEVSPATYAAWAADSDDTGPARDRVVAGVAETERHDGDVVAAAEVLARSFTRVVRGGR